jgi:hypothetical protein
VYVPSVRAAMGASVRKKRKASSALDWGEGFVDPEAPETDDIVL